MPRSSKSLIFSTGIDSQGNSTKREVDANGNKIKGSSITYPPQTTGVITYYSEPEEGDGYYGGTGLHTVTYIPWPKSGANNQSVINNFRGSVIIQATLASSPTESDWFDITSTYTEYTDVSYSNVLHNFKGNYVWIRAKVTVSAGVLREIAYNH